MLLGKNKEYGRLWIKGVKKIVKGDGSGFFRVIVLFIYNILFLLFFRRGEYNDFFWRCRILDM